MLQTAMLNKIARSEFSEMNGGYPNNNSDVGSIWADVIIEDSEDKGVFTSMLNAGLVAHGGKGRDATVWLTDAGFAEWQKAYPKQ